MPENHFQFISVSLFRCPQFLSTITFSPFTVLFKGLVILTVGSCDNSVIMPDEKSYGYNYFPVDKCLFREYKVEEIFFKGTGDKDTLNYYFYESVDSSYLDQEEDTVYVLRRLKRVNAGDPWSVDSLIPITKNKSMVLTTENNIPYIKMIFPVRDSRQWDGNAYNLLEPETYSFQETDQEYDLGDTVFQQTVRVIHSDFDAPFVEKDLRFEVFARDVGLIYRESIILHYCTESDCFGEGIISSGNIYRKTLTRFGYE